MKQLLFLYLLFMSTILTTKAQDLFEHTTSSENTNGHITTLKHKFLDGNPTAIVFVSQNYGQYNANEIGVWYNNNQWHIFNQNRKAMPAGTKFFVLAVPKKLPNAFTITANESNTKQHITELSLPKSMNVKDALIFVTQHYGKYNTSPVGVWLNNNQWNIYNEITTSEMPIGTKFNVLVLKKGSNKIGNLSVGAFSYQDAKPTTHISSISQKLTDQKLKLITTNNWKGVYNQNVTGTWFDGKQWTIFNQNREKMPQNVHFNVLVNSTKMSVNESVVQPVPVEIVTDFDLGEVTFAEFNHPTFTRRLKLPTHAQVDDVTFSLINNMAVLEGDILIGEGSDFTIEEPEPHPTPRTFAEFDPNGLGSTSSALIGRQSGGVIDRNWLWKNGVIPYSIKSGDFSTAEREIILAGIAELNEATNLNIVESWEQQKKIFFIKDTDIAGAGQSRVGRARIPNQRIRLNNGFTRETVIHEIIHAAGFWHEQSRRDRDRYVQINWDNITDGNGHNFDMHNSTGYQVTPYDIQSIMHYSGFAFARNNTSPTIIDRSTGNPVRNAGGLSAYDIDGLNTVYPLDFFNEGASRTPTALRSLKVTVLTVTARDLDGPGDENEFYIKTEIGPDFTWRPGNSGNPTRKQNSGKQRTTRSVVNPNWSHAHLLDPGEIYGKVYLQLREDDGLSGNERNDDTFNVNPFPGINEIELKVDTYGGEIYLGDIDGVFHEENYIGELGDEITLEGYEGGFKAQIRFRIEVE